MALASRRGQKIVVTDCRYVLVQSRASGRTQGDTMRSVAIKIRSARTAKGYSTGSNIVVSKVGFVDGQPEVISGADLRMESISSPEAVVLAMCFGELHLSFPCWLAPMANSPFLIYFRSLVLKIGDEGAGNSCPFDGSEGSPTRRGSATGANAVLAFKSRTRQPMREQRQMKETTFATESRLIS